MITILRREREKRGWTQEYVATQVGITKGALSNIESENRNPSFSVLVKLEDLFGMTHRELFAPAPEEPHNLSEP